MSRFFFIIGLVLGIVSCSNYKQEKGGQSSHPSQNYVAPNIIFILADDLGYGDLSCYGQNRFETPNIDNLAKDGIKFTNFYAGSTVCAPSRNTIMTGQHTGHCTVRGNGIKDRRISLADSDTTIAMLLQDAGYKTAAIGKWGLGEPESSAIPNKKGFDYWFGYLNQKKAHYYYPDSIWENQSKIEIAGNNNGQNNTNIHQRFTDKALRFIQKNKENPFFIYLAYTAPHAELVAGKEALEKYKGKYPEIPFEGSLSYPPNEFPRATYAAMVHQLDADVGKINQLIDLLGLSNNTLIVFTSDNGPESNGKHGCDPEFFNSTAGLRGVKRSLYEGGLKVPFIAKWAGTITAGQSTNHIGAMWDILPTFAEMANVDVPQSLDGISILPLFKRDSLKQKKHKNLYWEFHRLNRESVLAYREGKWKVVYYYGQNRIELYDLEIDPFEINDVSVKFKDIADSLKESLLNERTESEYWALSDKLSYQEAEDEL